MNLTVILRAEIRTDDRKINETSKGLKKFTLGVREELTHAQCEAFGIHLEFTPEKLYICNNQHCKNVTSLKV